MWICFVLTLLIMLFPYTNIHSYLIPWSQLLHDLCIRLSPASPFSEISQALICGKKIQSIGIKTLLIQTGLIHITVISGFHLHWIHKGLSKLQFSKYLVFILLILYTLVAQMAAPVLRAAIFIGISKFNILYKLNWMFSIKIFISVLLTLLLFPYYWMSFSLLLSWNALVAIGYAIFISKNFSQWKGRMSILIAVNVYIFLFFPLSQFIIPHPLGILSQLIFIPFIIIFLYPLTLLSYFISSLVFLSDYFWGLFFQILERASFFTPLFFVDGSNTPFIGLWIYTFTLNFVLYFLEKFYCKKIHLNTLCQNKK